jgi:O-antigen ligase
MIDRCRAALLVAAAAYLALLPSNALSFWRSLAFGTSAVLALTILVLAARDRHFRLPWPGTAVPAAVAAWAAWAVASLAWSIDPAFTARELKSDVLWALATMLIFYVAGTSLAGWRALAATALGGIAFWPALALGMHWSDTGWNARLAHMGVVAYSTYLVTVAPLILLLLWPAPLGFRERRRGAWVAVLLFALVLVTARLSENRIVWIALAAAIILLAVALWPTLSAMKIAFVAGGLLLAFALLFAVTARERAENKYSPATTVAESLSADPRLSIWKHAAKHIAERPWHGYGYGRLILRDELREDTGNRLLTHAHNMFVSQWLQTGGVGVALLVTLFAALGLRYLRLVRSGDGMLARLGAIGLAVLASFIVKNLTDDFFFRANAKLFFAVHALLLGVSAMRLRERRGVSAAAVPATAEAR